MMENYDIELNKAVDEIKKANAKLVCIQLPDGLKPKAREIQEYIEKNTDASVVVWLGSCWGGCDVPLSVEKLGVDLLIQWGHSHYIRAW
ncbi:MAG: diphthamide synthesis protein [Nanoarchaeota archaeon]